MPKPAIHATPAAPAAPVVADITPQQQRPPVIQQHGDVQVLARRHEVLWADGTALCIHPVLQGDSESLTLRAVHNAGNWALFDLRNLDKATADALGNTHWRERPGVLMYCLRAAFSTASQCMRAIDKVALTTWPGSPRPATPTKAATH